MNAISSRPQVVSHSLERGPETQGPESTLAGRTVAKNTWEALLIVLFSTRYLNAFSPASVPSMARSTLLASSPTLCAWAESASRKEARTMAVKMGQRAVVYRLRLWGPFRQRCCDSLFTSQTDNLLLARLGGDGVGLVHGVARLEDRSLRDGRDPGRSGNGPGARTCELLVHSDGFPPWFVLCPAYTRVPSLASLTFHQGS